MKVLNVRTFYTFTSESLVLFRLQFFKCGVIINDKYSILYKSEQASNFCARFPNNQILVCSPNFSVTQIWKQRENLIITQSENQAVHPYCHQGQFLLEVNIFLQLFLSYNN